ncbi:MAG: GNAT family N-acetyltransferase [Candidatus Kariarchaeaceae archaeon]
MDFVLSDTWELTQLVVANAKIAKWSTRLFRRKKGDIYYIDAKELKKEEDLYICSYKNAKLASEYELDGTLFSTIKNKIVFDINGDSIGRIIDAIVHIDYHLSFILGGSFWEEIMEDMGAIPDLDIFLPTNIITHRDEKGNFHVKYKKEMFQRKSSRPDIIRGVDFDRFPGERHHTFYKLRAEFNQFKEKGSWIEEKIENSSTASDISLTNLSHENAEMFIQLHDDIFFKSPDPVRGLTPEEVKLYDEEHTFIAYYLDTPVGFVYMPIYLANDGTLEGSIAGIGVVSKHRGKKVALKLLHKAIEFFGEREVHWVTCEVFEKNEPSRAMFESLGFEIFDHLVLEKVKK